MCTPFDQEGSFKYLVMELADAGSLDDRIESLKRVPELDVLDCGIKVASALGRPLKKGLLHLDIKPGNILFNADGEPLVDFGLARKTDADRTTTHRFPGPRITLPGTGATDRGRHSSATSIRWPGRCITLSLDTCRLSRHGRRGGGRPGAHRGDATDLQAFRKSPSPPVTP